MPELPEVERAVKLITDLVGTGKIIQNVETRQDSIVFSGISHEEFAHEITGKTLIGAKRYGKVFYLQIEGGSKLPVLHFGMTGMLQVRGEIPKYYRETPKTASKEWPPRFMKFILHLFDAPSNTKTELAFLDARRLGRIRLCTSPMTEPPISELGFDPILSMPSLERFSELVLKRACPIKALLLDQSFSAGVGNWVADEILYNARIHPEQRCNTLSLAQLATLYKQIKDVCQIAVAANADDTRFPEHWLFKHRWGKGKKAKSTLKLPSGQNATIKWITVGGRTSAFVSELQMLSGNDEAFATQEEELSKDSIELDFAENGDADAVASVMDSRKRKSLHDQPRSTRRKTAEVTIPSTSSNSNKRGGRKK